MPPDLARARVALFSVTAAACCGFLILPFTKIVLDRASFSGVLPSVTFILLLSIYLNWRGMTILRGLMEVVGCAVVVSYMAIVWSYAAISLAYPLADRSLIAIDRSLGFDWTKFALLVDRMPWLEAILFGAYQSFMYQLFVIPLMLAATGAVRGYLLMAAFGLLCMSASLISIWFPALGAHVALGVDPTSLKNLNPHFGYAFLEQFHAVRNNVVFMLSIDKVAGILTFPSVHAGTALLCTWACWGNRILVVPVAILNIAMAVSAVSHGSHYLIDVVAGIALAGAIATAMDFFARGKISLGRIYARPLDVR